MFDTGVKKIYRVTIETVRQVAKVHVCCSMSESRVIVAPNFFDDDDTINGQNSHSMLIEVFVLELKRLGNPIYSTGWSTSSFELRCSSMFPQCLS